jgi:hypothetical protein
VTAALVPTGKAPGIEAVIGAASQAKGTNMTTESTTTRPTHRVYAVAKKDGAEKGHWTEIGAAWPHGDGKGFNIKLNLVPLAPGLQIVLRVIDTSEKGQA